jgi:hypothetical protein
MTPEERFERHERWLEEHDRLMAEHDRRIAESASEHDRRMDRMDALLERQRKLGARTDARLDRAIRLAVREVRAERAKRRELDEKITQLAASQLLTEEALRDLKATVQAFIDSLRRGGNGHPSGGSNGR